MNNIHHHTTERHFIPALGYFVALPFIYLISVMPFRLLYLFADFVYLILYRLMGYRKKVVLQNLRNAFPDRSETEIRRICASFYHYLCDFFLETIKMLTISKDNLLRHCQLTTQAKEVFARFAENNKSVLLVMGHNGNWEWSCNAFNLLARHQLYVIYHPMSNPYFDGLMYRIRTRYQTKLIDMKNAYREMALHMKGLNATVFVADQTPQPDHAYWTRFMNQDTPVFKGMEVIARKMKLPVLYTSVKRVKRGYYEMDAELLEIDPVHTAEGDLTEKYIRRLEQDIITQPETWLWSHKRWKHKRVG